MFKVSYEWSFKINRNATLREKIGAALRNLAWHIDGRITLAVDIRSTPPLNWSQKAECIQFVNKRLGEAIGETVVAEAEERLLGAILKERHGAST